MRRHVLDDGVVLRLLQESDADALFALAQANRTHLGPWMAWIHGYRPEHAVAFIRFSRERQADNKGLHLALVRDNRMIGMVGFNEVDWTHRHAALGYWLAADAQGRGTMTAAVGALVDHAFGTWRLHRVVIRAAVDNARSRAVAERCGFQLEGVLRETELVAGRFLDHAVYGLLASEWESQKGVRRRDYLPDSHDPS